MQRKPVNSSQIAGYGYDPSTQTLEIEFKSGSIYQYTAVPADVAAGFDTADSVGRYFGATVKDRFETFKLDRDGRPQPIATAKASEKSLGYIRGLTAEAGLWYGNAHERVSVAWRDVLRVAGVADETVVKWIADRDFPLVDTFIANLSQAQASAVIEHMKSRRG